MSEHRLVFPLRFRHARLRALVRDIASREHISQNELIVQAIEHEVVARGALLAENLAATAQRLGKATGGQLEVLIARGIDGFAAGEQLQDPLRAYQLPARESSTGGLPDAVAAFRDAIG